MLILSLMLACLFAGALGTPIVSAAGPAPKRVPTTMWGPNGRLSWRCRSPFLVEVSDDDEHWVPSSTCLEGTCCSSLAAGPLCSRDACGLVLQEPGGGRMKGQVALGAQGHHAADPARRRVPSS